MLGNSPVVAPTQAFALAWVPGGSRGGTPRRRRTAALTTTANDALTLNIAVPDGVEATASNGGITLTGTVSYGSERTAAEQAVTYLTGVRNVTDDSDVAVDTSGNTVTLTGHVRTWAEHDAATVTDSLGPPDGRAEAIL